MCPIATAKVPWPSCDRHHVKVSVKVSQWNSQCQLFFEVPKKFRFVIVHFRIGCQWLAIRIIWNDATVPLKFINGASTRPMNASWFRAEGNTSTKFNWVSSTVCTIILSRFANDGLDPVYMRAHLECEESSDLRLKCGWVWLSFLPWCKIAFWRIIYAFPAPYRSILTLQPRILLGSDKQLADGIQRFLAHLLSDEFHPPKSYQSQSICHPFGAVARLWSPIETKYRQFCSTSLHCSNAHRCQSYSLLVENKAEN